MKIPVINEYKGPPPSAAEAVDLLSQLKSLGSVEATVIKLIEGKMLLNTSLGEILTSQNANIKQGDKVQIRYSEKDGKPLLRASTPAPEKTVISLQKAPQLRELLSPGQQRLASVIAVNPTSTTIKMGSTEIELPLRTALSKSQLLVLYQPGDKSIVEIRPVNAKPVVRALIAQIKLQQSEAATTNGLGKFLGLLKSTPNLAKAINQIQTDSAVSFSKSALAQNQSNSQPVLKPTNQGNQADARPSQSQPQTAAQLLMRTTTPIRTQRGHLQPSDAVSRGNDNQASTAPSARPDPTNSSPVRSTLQPNRSIDSVSSSGAPVALQKPGAELANKPVASQIRLILQSIPLLQTLQPEQIKQWFSYAGLVDSLRQNITTTEFNPFQALKKLASKELLTADIRRLLSDNPAGEQERADAETNRRDKHPFFQPNRLLNAFAQNPVLQRTEVEMQLRELIPFALAEGLKLIDQSLGQNLLQRAGVAVQQDNQSNFSMSLSVPYLDSGDLRELHIEIKQNNRSVSAQESSWQIRLNFEIAPLGAIACHLMLENDSVSASFYSEQTDTQRKIEAAIPDFKQQLANAGFQFGQIFSFSGRLTPDGSDKAGSCSESLIDIKV